MPAPSLDQSEKSRQQAERERAHFGTVVENCGELYWADRTAAAPRRQWIRANLLLQSATVSGLATARILDVGCGTAAYTRPLAGRTAATVIGVDVTPAALAYARSDAPPNLHLAAADVGNLPFADAGFDAVVGNAVLHHLVLERAVPELLRVLAPGGRFCFAEPNFLNPQVFLERRIPWLRRWLENSPDEAAFYRWSLRRRLESLGVEEVTIRPFDFLYPLTPGRLVPVVERIGRVLESVPVLREVAGSLLIRGVKGGAGP